LTEGRPLGLLGLEFASRRRNRVNVTISGTNADGVHLSVGQSFGNCPQYIQKRAFDFKRAPEDFPEAGDPVSLEHFDDDAKCLIAKADTFFIASALLDETGDVAKGVDASHRGGKPGFVKIDGDRLIIPDYAGNNHYNTLGNLLLNPKAGLTFVDFETGRILMLTGTTEILWDDDPLVGAFRGAERAIVFHLTRGLMLDDATALRFTFNDYSANTLLTGDWESAEKTLAAEEKRNEWRPFRIVRMVDESAVIRSFYLEPEDGEGLAGFQAGQYLTIGVTPEGAVKPVIRTYTLSSAPSDPLYRISVKREADGEVSRHLHDAFRVGDLIEVRAPRGDFFVDTDERRPAVLIAGGVGVTPMISMARQVIYEGARTRHTRPLTIFHAAKTSGERAFFEDFRALSDASGGKIAYLPVLSGAEDGEKAGLDYVHLGRINADLFRATLALDDYDFFLCGPAGFMQAAYDALLAVGVSDARIFAEAFGPASLKRVATTAQSFQPEESADAAVIHFSESAVEQGWTKRDGNLLSFAESHGLSPAYGCRSGSCGSCVVKIRKGAVAYLSEPTAPREADEALICCAVPAKDSEELELAL
ncbi:MAG: pyridoxamine 5'-phosphate oxidase family protein, partial [Pseudomonadota bacterium]